jgi:hypothetical protein
MKHCATIAAEPKIRVSPKVSSAIPMRIKRKLTEIVPVISGSWTLKREARMAVRRYAMNLAGSSTLQV